MTRSQCLFNSAIALRQIFISNAPASEGSGRVLLLPTMAVPLRPSASSPSRRLFSTQPAAQQRSKNNRLDTRPKATTAKIMRDYDIIYPWVQVRTEDGKLGAPLRTSAVLKQLNRETHSLVLVVPPRKDDASKGPEYPIVRLVDKKAEYAAVSAAKGPVEQKKGPKIVSKEVELNWAIAPHDLETRMGRLAKFLEKGYRVQLTIANPKKKAKRRATDDEAKAVYKRVKQTLEEMVGTTEYKPQEGLVKQTVIMYLQGSGKPAESPPAAVASSAEEEVPATEQQEGRI
ncbi:hypothetical protein BT67DRAFT_438825 [Trichocladium antarcticum]|uniref:Translation initiation factor IF-3 n=1 Tax=Trichocladium antarcticum TaxID=1450529 RepID=A0AAN6ZH10_9PEZI|nr:hypothetical protein BT67DRAFT_438825 [Trichocladium antarcticum]